MALTCAVHELVILSSMICPFCSANTPPTWQSFKFNTDELGRVEPHHASQLSGNLPAKNGEPKGSLTVTVTWLRCANEECREFIVQISRALVYQGTSTRGPKIENWLGLPKHKAPPAIDLSLIPAAMKKDYLEAFTILEDSPRMSAVLSRRILADLLKKYDHATQFNLTARINAFESNTHHPSRLRESLHYLREIGDFAAHTQTDQAAATPTPSAAAPATSIPFEEVVIDATKEEAEWTLKVVSDLFDYFISAPARDEALKQAMDQKIKAANRKPLR